jgi:hypothetical protein
MTHVQAGCQIKKQIARTTERAKWGDAKVADLARCIRSDGVRRV